MIRYQARTTLSLSPATLPKVVMPIWSVEELPPTAEVVDLVFNGLLVPEGPDGTFPDPVVAPARCCGQR